MPSAEASATSPEEYDPERIFARVFTSLTQRWSDTITFRRLAELGKPQAVSHLRSENYRFALNILEDPEYDRYFIDRRAAVDFFGGVGGIADSTTARQLASFQGAIDAASLVFMHSALDAAVSDLCHAAALLAPADWQGFVHGQRISLSELSQTPYEEILRRKVWDHVLQLDRESLLTRVDRLFAVCKPPAGYEPRKGFEYDRNELERLDRLRQQLVHSVDPHMPISGIEDALEFLLGAGLHTWAMLNFRYGVKLNPLYALNIQIPSSPPGEPPPN